MQVKRLAPTSNVDQELAASLCILAGALLTFSTLLDVVFSNCCAFQFVGTLLKQ